MYIYNVTTKVSHGIHTAWVNWMREEHIPAVMQSGCFTGFKFVRLLEIEEEEGPTFAVQFSAAAKADYDRYINEFAPALRQDTFNRWGNQLIAFRSLMQVVN
ncbi:MAG: DUF4286 family protein [Sphingobacteriia bacterium]|nr:DUF4286 family protein [Sphingobacteriia bacterium]